MSFMKIDKFVDLVILLRTYTFRIFGAMQPRHGQLMDYIAGSVNAFKWSQY